LPEGQHDDQHVLMHPVVQIVFDGSDATVSGVQRQRFTRVLEGQGRVLGVMFRGFETDAANEDIVGAIDDLLSGAAPEPHQPCEETTTWAEQVAQDRDLHRVDDLARWAGVSVRQLQRSFADHIGVGPKWVIRQYRLYEIAEQAAHSADIDWAHLAARLGYADQAHLTRDFTRAVGLAPQRYAQAIGT